MGKYSLKTILFIIAWFGIGFLFYLKKKETIKTFFDERQEKNLPFLKALKPYECFTYKNQRKAQLSWEKDYIWQEEPYMIIKLDNNGVLYAQPDLEKRKNQFGSYWIRSDKWDNTHLWAFPGLIKINCPDSLNKEFIKKLIQTEYQNKFDWEKIK